jgi:hypothetical protein
MDTTSEEQDGDNSTADRLSLTISNPKRMSMDQYYISQQTHLPDYGALTQPHQPRPELSIEPREDEGQEILPSYSSDISLENVFMKKMELQGAVRRADDRNWNRVFVTLQGTALTFHKYKSSGVFEQGPNSWMIVLIYLLKGRKESFCEVTICILLMQELQLTVQSLSSEPAIPATLTDRLE